MTHAAKKRINTWKKNVFTNFLADINGVKLSCNFLLGQARTWCNDGYVVSSMSDGWLTHDSSMNDGWLIHDSSMTHWCLLHTSSMTHLVSFMYKPGHNATTKMSFQPWIIDDAPMIHPSLIHVVPSHYAYSKVPTTGLGNLLQSTVPIVVETLE